MELLYKYLKIPPNLPLSIQLISLIYYLLSLSLLFKLLFEILLLKYPGNTFVYDSNLGLVLAAIPTLPVLTFFRETILGTYFFLNITVFTCLIAFTHFIARNLQKKLSWARLAVVSLSVLQILLSIIMLFSLKFQYYQNSSLEYMPYFLPSLFLLIFQIIINLIIIYSLQFNSNTKNWFSK